MPIGDKVGDAYIEVTPVLNDKAFKNLERNFSKHFDGIEKKHSKKVTKAGDSLAGDFAKGFANVGSSIASLLPAQLEGAFKTPGVGIAITAAGVTLGALLAGAIGGAVYAGLQGGALGAGVALAIKNDPKLQQAGKDLGNKLMAGFQDAASRQIGPDVEKAFGFLSGSNFAGGLANDFESLLAPLKGTLVPLVSNISAGLDKITAGAKNLALKGAPFIDTLGEGFKGFGEAVEKVFNNFSDHAPELNAALKDTLGIINNLVVVMGQLVTNAAEFWDMLKFKNDFKENADGLGRTTTQVDLYSQALKDYAKSSPEVQKALDAYNARQEHANYNVQRAAAMQQLATEKTYTLGNRTKLTAEAYANLSKQISDALTEQKKYDDQITGSLDAQIAYEQAIDDLSASFKHNGKTLDITTQKGRDNYKATEDAIAAAKGEAEAVYAKTGSLEAAKKKYAELLKPIEAATGKTEANRKKVKDLEKAYGDFSKLPPISKTITIKTPNLNAVAATIRSLTGNKTLTITTVKRNLAKDPHAATGGLITGPGTGTSDSIPAMLSNGEYVIKASSAQKIGLDKLNALNSGKVSHFAKGGTPGHFKDKGGHGRGKTGAEVAQYKSLISQISGLTTTINAQTKALTKYTGTIQDVTDKLNGFVNLSTLDTEGKSAGDLIAQLGAKKQKSKDFEANVKGLKTKGLSEEALQQIISAGPDSDLGKILNQGLQALDVARINDLLKGDESEAKRIADAIYPKGAGTKASLAKNTTKRASLQAKAKKLKAPRAKGATISYAGGHRTALFSKKEMHDQQLKAGTYVTVIVDGKEVRAIVKEEQTKAQAKANQKIKSGRR